MPRFRNYENGSRFQVSERNAWARTPIEEFQIRDWGRWMPDVGSSTLEPNEVFRTYNVEFEPNGSVRRRNGYSLVVDEDSGSNPLTVADHLHVQPTNAVIGSATAFEQNELVIYSQRAQGRLFYNTTGNILGSSAGLIDSTHSVGGLLFSNLNPADQYPLNFLLFNDTLIVTSQRYGGAISGSNTGATHDNSATGATRPVEFDIRANVWSRSTVPDLTASGVQTGVPRAKSAVVAYDRVFYANVAAAGQYDYSSRVYWSAPGTYNSVRSGADGDWLEVGADDGQQISKVVKFGSQIIVFKDKSVWALVGTNEDTFALYSLTSQYGCQAPNSVVEHKGRLFFLDAAAGVMMYDGSQFHCLSTDINREVLDKIDRSRLWQAAAFVDSDRERVYVSFPHIDFESPQQLFMFDFRVGSWVFWNYGFSDAAQVRATFSNTDPVGLDNPIWVVGPYDEPGIVRINDPAVWADHGEAPDSFSLLETAWWNPGSISDAHRLRELNVLFDERVGGQVTVEAYRDFSLTPFWRGHGVTVPPPGSNPFDQHDIRQLYDRGRWTWLKLRFASFDAEGWQVNGVGVRFSKRPKRRVYPSTPGPSPVACLEDPSCVTAEEAETLIFENTVLGEADGQGFAWVLTSVSGDKAAAISVGTGLDGANTLNVGEGGVMVVELLNDACTTITPAPPGD